MSDSQLCFNAFVGIGALFKMYDAAAIICKNCRMYCYCSHIGSLDCKHIKEKFMEVCQDEKTV